MARQIPPPQIPPESQVGQRPVASLASPAPQLLAERGRQRLRMNQPSPMETDTLHRDFLSWAVWIPVWQKVRLIAYS